MSEIVGYEGDINEPPRRFDESGMDLWVQAHKLGWISKNSDLVLLALICEQLDERDLLRAFVLDNVEAWRERASLRKLEEQISQNLSKMVMTPIDRLKAGIQEVKRQSKLEALIAKRNDQ
jgi:hypothetical protein